MHSVNENPTVRINVHNLLSVIRVELCKKGKHDIPFMPGNLWIDEIVCVCRHRKVIVG